MMKRVSELMVLSSLRPANTCLSTARFATRAAITILICAHSWPPESRVQRYPLHINLNRHTYMESIDQLTGVLRQITIDGIARHSHTNPQQLCSLTYIYVRSGGISPILGVTLGCVLLRVPCRIYPVHQLLQPCASDPGSDVNL